MVIKPRQVPVRLLALYFIYRRLPKGHPRKEAILNLLKRAHTGYLGEKEFDYYLSLFPNDRMIVLHDLRLEIFGHFFQMDTAILSSYFDMVNEIKNFKGELFFDLLLQQCTRTYRKQVESVNCPIAQSQRNSKLFSLFKKGNELKTVPQIPLAIISHSNTMIKTNPGLEKELATKVIHAEYFPNRLNELFKKYPNRRLTEGQVLEQANFLLKNHTPLVRNWAAYYGILKTDLQKGVECPRCGHFSMEWEKGKWCCPSCLTTSKTAHEQTIYEHLLLIDSTISNAQCCELLGIFSPSLAKRLLNNMGLSRKGKNRSVVYFLPPNWIDQFNSIEFHY